jgi:methyl-galactoside transport system substrate-binding protein
MMKKRKGLLLLPFLCLCACAKSNPLIQIFLYDAADTFIASLSSSLQGKLAGFYDATVWDASRKQATQNAQILDAIGDSRTKVLVVNTVDRLASSAIVEKAESVSPKLPVIFMNREPLKSVLAPENDDWVKQNCFYVGSDPASDGQLQAEIANSLFGGPSAWASSPYNKNHDEYVDVAIIKGEQGHQDSELRSANCIDHLKELNYKVNILETDYANWERSVATTLMATFYKPNIELLFCNNDDMALGAIDFLNSSAGKALASKSEGNFDERYCPIIGVDATEAGKAAVADGSMTGTVLNDASTQALVLSDLISYSVSGKEMPTYGQSVVIDDNYYHVRGKTVTKSTL